MLVIVGIVRIIHIIMGGKLQRSGAMKGHQRSVRKVLDGFAEHTSMHGVGSLHSAR